MPLFYVKWFSYFTIPKPQALSPKRKELINFMRHGVDRELEIVVLKTLQLP